METAERRRRRFAPGRLSSRTRRVSRFGLGALREPARRLTKDVSIRSRLARAKVLRMPLRHRVNTDHTLEEVGSSSIDARAHPPDRSQGAAQAPPPVAFREAAQLPRRRVLISPRARAAATTRGQCKRAASAGFSFQSVELCWFTTQQSRASIAVATTGGNCRRRLLLVVLAIAAPDSHGNAERALLRETLFVTAAPSAVKMPVWLRADGLPITLLPGPRGCRFPGFR